MGSDIFGYNRTFKTDSAIASSEFLSLSMGGNVSLMQSVNVSYQREIAPVYQVGDSTVYFQHGHASGSLDVTRLVGAGGLLSSFKTGNCGKIGSMSVSISGSGACSVSGGGSVHFDGALLQSVGFNATAGQLQIAETAKVIFGSMG